MSSAIATRPYRALRSLMNVDPFENLQQEVNSLLGRFRGDQNGDWPEGALLPSVDLCETGDAVQVKMDVPGVKPEEIEIEVTGNILRVKGEHKEEKEEKGSTYHFIERRKGAFARVISLPASVKEEKVTAECKNGVLTISLPKIEVATTQKVKVVAK